MNCRQGFGKAQDIVFDTGAGVNVVSTAAAKALGMDVYDVGTRLSGIGEQQGGFAVARSTMPGAVDLRKANIGMDYFIKFKKVVFKTKDMFVRLFP